MFRDVVALCLPVLNTPCPVCTVVLSVCLTGLLLWWWRRECQSSRALVLRGDITLKESQDPLVPVRRLETSPLKVSVTPVNRDTLYMQFSELPDVVRIHSNYIIVRSPLG